MPTTGGPNDTATTTYSLAVRFGVFVNPEWPTLMLGSGPPPLSFRPPSLTVGQSVA